jgi:hypothetical protein
MDFRKPPLAISLALASLALLSSQTTAQNKPAPPTVTVPPLQQARVVATCVECDAPFDTATHKQLLDDLAANPYVAELRRALYVQDIVHQFESKAHFDNCDFDSAMDYISSLLDEAGQHVEKASTAKQSGIKEEVEGPVRKAFFALGQAMHAVQDFYAHTNYVELTVRSAKRPDAIDVIEPWTTVGRERIGRLRQGGLVSGFVFWGFPQKCSPGALSHADLAKDSANTKSGKKSVPHLQNLSQYRIAEFLARQASLSLMRYSFQRWPLLKEVNGNDIAFEIILDHRGV